MAKKVFILISGFLTLSVIYMPSLWAFDVPQTTQKLQEVYDKTAAWQADFNQDTYVELIDKTVAKKGTILVKKPSQLKIDYLGDGARHYVSNGETLWVYDEATEQVLEYKKISKILASEALTFLKGLGNLKNDFVVQAYAEKEAMIENQGLLLLELIPRKTDTQIEKIVVGVNGRTYLIEEMTLFNQSQNKSHYSFKNINLHPVIGKDVFELDSSLKNKIVSPHN